MEYSLMSSDALLVPESVGQSLRPHGHQMSMRKRCHHQLRVEMRGE